MATGKQLVQTFEKLAAQRASFDNLYREAARYCLPHEQAVPQDTPLDQGREYYASSESVGVRSAQMLASGLFSNTVSLGREWFGLRATDEALNGIAEVQDWMADTADRVLKALQNSNFNLQLHEQLIMLVVFGTGCLFSEMSTTGGRLVFRNFSPRNLYLTEGPDGLVDGVWRRFWFTARQAVKEFGGKVSPEVQKAAKKPDTSEDRFEFIHVVMPRKGRKGPGSKGMPYASYYVEVNKKLIVRESGFSGFPFAVPRFYTLEGEPYGRSPAMYALPDLRQLDRASADWVDAVEMAVCPPVFLPDVESLINARLIPGGLNFYDPTRGGKPWSLPVGNNLQDGMSFLERKEKAIREHFFTDIFLMLEERKNMSATEVVERINEKIQSISPVVSRLQSELFQPLIVRVVNLMAENGMLLKPPAILRKKNYDVVYTSRLDARLAQTEVENLGRAITQASQICNALKLYPRLAAIFDEDKVIRMVSRNNNVDLQILRSEAEAKKIIAAQEQAQAMMEQRKLLADKVAPVDVTQPVQDGSPLSLVAQETGVAA